MKYEPKFKDGKLACYVCGEIDVPIGLVFKRGESVYLCDKCRKKNPCGACGRWVRILTLTIFGPRCSRCH